MAQKAKHLRVKCYTRNAETSAQSTLYRLCAETSCLKYRWCAQNTEMLMYIRPLLPCYPVETEKPIEPSPNPFLASLSLQLLK